MKIYSVYILLAGFFVCVCFSSEPLIYKNLVQNFLITIDPALRIL